MNPFAAADDELRRWERAGLVPRFWLRDDDATAPSQALDRLITIIRRHDVPLLLAVIPVGATKALADRLENEPLVTPCTHGYAHKRHTPETERAVELGGTREPDAVLAELGAGRQRLIELFGARLSAILVPPWNRIAPEIARRVHECGFGGLSTWSWQEAETRLPQLNTHLDIIDWHAGRKGRPLDWAAAELARRLREARERGGRPVGLLSHHLVHDAQAWATLEALIAFLARDRALRFHRADDLIEADQ